MALSIEKLKNETAYAVDLLRPVKVGRTWLRPGQPAQMLGKRIKEVAGDVAEVRPLAT